MGLAAEARLILSLIIPAENGQVGVRWSSSSK